MDAELFVNSPKVIKILYSFQLFNTLTVLHLILQMGGFPCDSESGKYILINAEKSFGAVGMRADAVIPGSFISRDEAILMIQDNKMRYANVSSDWAARGVDYFWFLPTPNNAPFNEFATNMLPSAQAVRGDAIIFARS